MEKEIKTFAHPISGDQITGYKLEAGDTLQTGDKYDSTTGKWEDCSIGGLTIMGTNSVLWIRPERD